MKNKTDIMEAFNSFNKRHTIINYGGVPTPVYKVIEDMKKMGATQQQINLWFSSREYSIKEAKKKCPVHERPFCI